MATRVDRRASVATEALFGLLNPVPFGCFVAALVFDVVYLRTAVVFWNKAAAWAIVIGLLAAVVPRLLNLVQVWLTRTRSAPVERLDFWLNLAGTVAAIFNAFVHSRDAYAIMPAGFWLSLATVVLIGLGNLVGAAARPARRVQP